MPVSTEKKDDASANGGPIVSNVPGILSAAGNTGDDNNHSDTKDSSKSNNSGDNHAKSSDFKSQWDPTNPFSPKKGAFKQVQGFWGETENGQQAVTKYNAQDYLHRYENGYDRVFSKLTPVGNDGKKQPSITGSANIVNAIKKLAKVGPGVFKPSEASPVVINKEGETIVPAHTIIVAAPMVLKDFDFGAEDQVYPKDTVIGLLDSNGRGLIYSKIARDMLHQLYGPPPDGIKMVPLTFLDVPGKQDQYKLIRQPSP
jgi:hypothetical protein